MLLELPYRLAVEETPFIQAIRNNVITFITPVIEVDGREKHVDTYYYNKKLPNNASISRIMFVENSIFKFVLHVGPFNAFLLKLHAQMAAANPNAGANPPAAGAPANAAPGAGDAAAQPPPSPDPKWVEAPSWLNGKTFADILLDQDTVTQISKLVVFVSASTNLRDAKASMDKVNGAQDVIVTPTGNATETMLGWLTNVDLTKAVQVS